MLSIIFTYFCVPECKGKTLEQINWLFANGTKLRDFAKADASNMLNEQMGTATVSRGDQDCDEAYAVSKYPKSSIQIAR